MIILRDPVIDTIRFLATHVSETYPEVPAGFEWGSGRLVTVEDAGGTGEREVILDDVMLTIRVFHTDQFKASELARNVHGLLREWADAGEGRPIWNGTIQRPTYDPDPDSGAPGYSMTVRLIFRASEQDKPVLP